MPAPDSWPSLVPDEQSITWRRAGDARVLTAAGYALLLQVAHPTVGAGVNEHSDFRRDPWGRLLRTLDYACTMVYGGAEAAGAMGRRIRAMHRAIRGTLPGGGRYHALEPEAYAWVHATLADGIESAHGHFGCRLGREQREALWQEWRLLGRLLGIRPGDLPESWVDYRAYVDEMKRYRLRRTGAVAGVMEALAAPVPPKLARAYAPLWPMARMPLAHLVGLTTRGLLGAELRVRLGIPWSWRDQAQLHALSASLRAATPLMPRALRNTGPGYLRWRADAIAAASGRTSPDALSSGATGVRAESQAWARARRYSP